MRPLIRFINEDDYPRWRPLWDGYNQFYGRFGATALPEEILGLRGVSQAALARPADSGRDVATHPLIGY